MENELDNAVAKYNPDSVIAIAMNPKNGEVLAMSSRPNFNSNEYKNFHNVLLTLEKYNEIRNEKTFVKKDNVFIINETETYILLNPITFLGSIRYGSNTKWCTTSKLREGYFNSYSKGYLAYQI